MLANEVTLVILPPTQKTCNFFTDRISYPHSDVNAGLDREQQISQQDPLQYSNILS